MKRAIGKYFVTGIFILISFISFTQHNDHSVPAWVSDKGYWVLESNLQQPLQHTLRFYSNKDVLIGVQEITSKKLNIKRRKVKMQLKSMLESSLLAWTREKTASDSSSLVKKP